MLAFCYRQPEGSLYTGKGLDTSNCELKVCVNFAGFLEYMFYRKAGKLINCLCADYEKGPVGDSAGQWLRDWGFGITQPESKSPL